MAKKKLTVKFKKEEIENLSNDKPGVYKILNKSGDNIYTGIDKRGRVVPRVKEHLSGGPDPIKGGVKVKLIPKPTIKDAEKSEKRIIKLVKPRHNKKGK